MIEAILFYTIVITVGATAGVSLYGIVVKPHVVKKLVLLTVLSDAVNILVVLFGYYLKAVSPPVYPGGSLEGFVFPSSEELVNFSSVSVDPMPQVLIVTAIVIGLAELTFLSLITFKLGSLHKTLMFNRMEAEEE